MRRTAAETPGRSTRGKKLGKSKHGNWIWFRHTGYQQHRGIYVHVHLASVSGFSRLCVLMVCGWTAHKRRRRKHHVTVHVRETDLIQTEPHDPEAQSL